LAPDAITPNALDLVVVPSAAAAAARAQTLAQSLRLGLVDQQAVIDMIDDRVLFARAEPGSEVALASLTGGGLAASDVGNGEAQAPTGATGVGGAAWGRAYGTLGHAPTTGTLAGFDERREGVIAGIDWRFSEYTVGGAFHYANTDAPFKDGSITTMQSYQGLVYGAWRDGPLYATGLVSAGENAYSIKRNPAQGLALVSSNPTGTLVTTFAEAGYAFAFENAEVTPYVDFSYLHQGVGAFAESGGFGALSVAPANGNSLSTTIGIRATTKIDLGSSGALMPEVRIGWAHEFLDQSQALTAQLVGAPISPFTVAGVGFGRESAIVGFGITHEFAPDASFFVDYAGQFTGGFNQSSASAGIKVKF
jgi:outer membrane autotransporter protein